MAGKDQHDEYDPPPHDASAEQVAIGAAMLSPSALAEVAKVITSGDLYRPAHQTVFDAITALAAEGLPVDVITVAARLEETGLLAKVGGAPYLHTMIAAVPTAANGAWYARIVREKSTDRHMITAGTQIVQAGWSGGDREDVIGYAYRVLDAAAARAAPSGARDLAELMPASLDQIEHGTGRGLSLGWPDLDALTGGVRPGQVTVVASRPAVGKTAVLLNAATRLALDGNPTLVATVEQDAHECIERILAAQASVDLARFRDGTMGDTQWQAVSRVLGELSEAPLRINDDPGLSLAGIRSDLLDMRRAKTPARAVIVDYIQLMAGARGESREREVAALSRGLKLLAREYQVAVIVGAQLNRGPEMRSDHRPVLADLRDSGSLEQDADVVILLYRSGMYDETAGTGMDMIVAKHRGGPTGVVQVEFRGWYSRADTIEWSHDTVLRKIPAGLPDYSGDS